MIEKWKFEKVPVFDTNFDKWKFEKVSKLLGIDELSFTKFEI